MEIRDISVAFGGIRALSEVSLSVAPGQLVGLIGPNGAGKSTLIDVVSGFTRPGAGTVTMGGESLLGVSPDRIARAGLMRSFQATELFAELTILDNLLVAADGQSSRRYITDLFHPGSRGRNSEMDEVIAEFGLEGVLDQLPSQLPQGTLRVASVARSLLASPRVILLDEPAAGLMGSEVDDLSRAIQHTVRSRGISVVLVEHDVDLIMSICDKVVVLNFGQKISEGTPSQVSSDAGVIAAYLGEPNAQEVPRADEPEAYTGGAWHG